MKVFEKLQFGQITAYKAAYSPFAQPQMSVYAYQVGPCLIDTGQFHMRHFFAEALSSARIETILLTHHHEDHSGNARRLSEQHGAAVLGHPLTVKKMEKAFNILPYQHFMWGKAEPVEVTPFSDAIEVGPYRFEPIHTPGHSKDHTVFREPNQGWLFSGDLFMGEKVKYFRSDEIMADHLQSLQKILTYDFEWLLCAHNPATSEAPRKLRRKLNFLQDVEGEIRSLWEKGMPEKAIIKKMKDREVKSIKYICMGNVSFANVVRAVVRENEAGLN